MYCIVLYCITQILYYSDHWSHLFSGSSPVLSKWPLWQEKGEWEACWLGSAILTPSESNSPRRIVRELPETAVPGVKRVRWKWRRGNSCPWCESSDAENDDDWNELRSEMCEMKWGRWTWVKWNKKCEDESNETRSVKMSQMNRCENEWNEMRGVKMTEMKWKTQRWLRWNRMLADQWNEMKSAKVSQMKWKAWKWVKWNESEMKCKKCLLIPAKAILFFFFLFCLFVFFSTDFLLLFFLLIFFFWFFFSIFFYSGFYSFWFFSTVQKNWKVNKPADKNFKVQLRFCSFNYVLVLNTLNTSEYFFYFSFFLWILFFSLVYTYGYLQYLQ